MSVACFISRLTRASGNDTCKVYVTDVMFCIFKRNNTAQRISDCKKLIALPESPYCWVLTVQHRDDREVQPLALAALRQELAY